jgi:hypothetical protein|nr:MAG TPA: hypothetical protein [Bacteriophage sp.]DAN17147.1 MAG TPA: hypothetical protein [Caudoviricetes sp.]
MLTEIVWFMIKAYIVLIFIAAAIRSEQILYDTSTYIFRGDKKNGMYGCVVLNVFIIVCVSMWTVMF